MPANNLENRVAFITGGSSGIGAAVAAEYARRGADVVLAARRVERLEQVAADIRDLGRRALAVQCDVAVDGDLDRAVAQAVEELGRIDRVVANAGFGVAGPLERLTLEDYERQFETNVFGVLRTVYATREALVETRGCLAIIGSVSGFVGLGGSSPYSMSKAAVHLLADSLRYEFGRLGVGVTLVVPGFVESEIRQVDNRGVYHPEAPDSAPPWMRMPAPVAARKIVRAVERRRRVRVLTGHGRLGVFLQRHTPGLLAFAVGRLGSRVRRGES
jgi:NAD(P)-dependent dehydrogenase (short-subunit alcohol dehydrogenase family)